MALEHLRPIVVAIFVLSITAPAGATQYSIRDLGALSGRSMASGINDQGMVVGSARTLGGGLANGWYWTEATGMVQVPNLSGTFGMDIKDVNNHGNVIATAHMSASGFGSTKAVFVPFGSDPQYAGFPDGGSSFVRHMNQSNMFVAQGLVAQNGVANAYYWTPDSGPVSLSYLVGSNDTIAAYDVNNAGLVVGSFGQFPTSQRGFIWSQGGGLTEVTLPTETSTILNGINDLGQCVGRTEDGGNGPKYFFWDSGTVQFLFGHVNSFGVNLSHLDNTGTILGSVVLGLQGPTEAEIWNPGDSLGHRLVDDVVDAQGWTLTSASDMNARGQIVGTGVNPDGMQHAFLLTPVPEGSTFVALALGGALALRRKRRQP